MALPKKKAPASVIKAGDKVEYTGISGTIHVRVLAVLPSGKLSLNTRAENPLVKVPANSKEKVGTMVWLTKNVTVLPHRVKKVKRG